MFNKISKISPWTFILFIFIFNCSKSVEQYEKEWRSSFKAEEIQMYLKWGEAYEGEFYKKEIHKKVYKELISAQTKWEVLAVLKKYKREEGDIRILGDDIRIVDRWGKYLGAVLLDETVPSFWNFKTENRKYFPFEIFKEFALWVLTCPKGLTEYYLKTRGLL